MPDQMLFTYLSQAQSQPYIIIRRTEDGHVYDAMSGTIVEWDDANYARYAVMYQPRDGGEWVTPFPALPAGAYRVQTRYVHGNGTTPSAADCVLKTNAYHWDGERLYNPDTYSVLSRFAAAVTLIAPVGTDGARLTLVAGDDYQSAERRPTWTVTGYTGPALEPQAVLRISEGLSVPCSAAVISATATITVDGADLLIAAPLTSEQTAALSPDAMHGRYQLVATTTQGDTHTIRSGNVSILPRIQTG